MRLKKLLLLFMFLGAFFVNITNTFAYDLPDGLYDCKTSYVTINKNTIKSYYKEFDIILIGTIIKANDIGKIEPNKRTEKDWYVSIKIEENFKNIYKEKIKSDKTITLYAPGGYGGKNICYDYLTYKNIGSKYLIFAKYNERFKKPLLWRASYLNQDGKQQNIKTANYHRSQRYLENDSNEEIAFLRKLSKQKTLKQRWDELWD